MSKLMLLVVALTLTLGTLSIASAIGGAGTTKLFAATGTGPAPGPSNHLTIDTGHSGNSVTSVKVKRNGVWVNLPFVVESGGDPIEIDISPKKINPGEDVEVDGSNAQSGIDSTPTIVFS